VPQKGRFSKNKKTPQVFIQSAICAKFQHDCDKDFKAVNIN